MADFYKDKEMTIIIGLCSAMDRRKYLIMERDELESNITYQVERTDKGMSAMSRAEVITMLYSKYIDIKCEIARLNAEISKLQEKVVENYTYEGEDNGSDD